MIKTKLEFDKTKYPRIFMLSPRYCGFLENLYGPRVINLLSIPIVFLRPKVRKAHEPIPDPIAKMHKANGKR